MSESREAGQAACPILRRLEDRDGQDVRIEDCMACLRFKAPDAALHAFVGEAMHDPGPNDPELIEPGTHIPHFTEIPAHHAFLTEQEKPSATPTSTFAVAASPEERPACQLCQENDDD